MTVLLQGAQPIQTLAIPQAAVLSDQQGNYVYVVGPDNKALVPRRITLGQATGALTTVTTGLKQGEVIISDGLQRVRPNQPVEPGALGARARGRGRATWWKSGRASRVEIRPHRLSGGNLRRRQPAPASQAAPAA